MLAVLASPRKTKTGAASSPTTQTKAGTGAPGLAELSQKVDQLTNMMRSFAPVVKELKTAYDAAKQAGDTISSEGEGEDNDGNSESPVKGAKSNGSETPDPIRLLVDDLVQEVMENEQTEQPLNGKISAKFLHSPILHYACR